MCGICGQFNFLRQEPVIQSDLVRMTRTIAHRGPDDEGFFISGPLGLGFRRLSIIDLSSGHQPMSNQDHSVWIIFNGEIFNYRELRNRLQKSNHVFRTNSDTEVIICGYEEWGLEVFTRLIGMFDLAIWDSRKERLVIARDAMGIKPLYYKIDDGKLFFGSELKAILAADNTSYRTEDIDPVALNLFLRYRYTPSPLTIYGSIQKLAPGTMLIVDREGFAIKRWYQYKPRPFSPMKSTKQAEFELLELYKQAVKRHLISDVPVGLLLSGGLDSALLLALMNLEGDSWPTYTVGYGEGFIDDELEDAARTAAYFNSKHLSVKISIDDFEKSLSRVISFLEEPIAASSIVPMYFVCERASRDVKVALVGQGPDELFGGYPRHLGLRYVDYWIKTPAILRILISSIILQLPRNEMLKRGVYAFESKDILRRYQYVFSLMPGSTIDKLFNKGLLPPNAGDKILECWADLLPLMVDTDSLGGLQFLEIRSSLPDELLMYSDKLSMAHGLELRVPYLDRDIVEYAERLSSPFKVRYGSRKWVHRMISRSFLPKEVIHRKKRGFASNVVDKWFQESMSKKFDAYLLDSRSLMYQFLQHSQVTQLLKEHQVGRSDNHKILFSLVVLEEWLRGR